MMELKKKLSCRDSLPPLALFQALLTESHAPLYDCYAAENQEISEARYNTLNTQLKDLIVKTKLARDGLIEDAAITFIVCQERMFKVR